MKTFKRSDSTTMSRVVRGGFPDRQFDVDFWQAQGDEAIFEAETIRLLQSFPVELAITTRHLQRWIPDGAVAEVGVGGGCYSEHLARRGCLIHLVDVSQRLLDATCARLREVDLQGQILGADLASARLW